MKNSNGRELYLYLWSSFVLMTGRCCEPACYQETRSAAEMPVMHVSPFMAAARLSLVLSQCLTVSVCQGQTIRAVSYVRQALDRPGMLLA